ncbi:hypothetical protein COOONC_12849, partial [Cooperia oncophora]
EGTSERSHRAFKAFSRPHKKALFRHVVRNGAEGLRGHHVIILTLFVLELRTYICQSNDCRLEFEGNRDEWVAINDNGCYLEYKDDIEETVEFCPLQCNTATSAIIIEETPENEDCTVGSGVNVVRRRNDWFMWRGEDCQKVQANFKIGCTFDKR